jgi:hypothetical protein
LAQVAQVPAVPMVEMVVTPYLVQSHLRVVVAVDTTAHQVFSLEKQVALVAEVLVLTRALVLLMVVLALQTKVMQEAMEFFLILPQLLAAVVVVLEQLV